MSSPRPSTPRYTRAANLHRPPPSSATTSPQPAATGTLSPPSLHPPTSSSSLSADTPSDEDDEAPSDDAAGADIPLTMSASVVLSQLPRDATAALAAAAASDFGPDEKVVVRLKPVGGSAPALRREVCKISAASRFEAVVGYVRRTLKVGAGESLFLYVNSTFAPALDEVVGNLHRCFKDSSGQLNVSYSMTPAFG